MATRVLIVGLGSIGLRHARLLQTHFPNAVEVAALRSDERRAGNAMGLPEFFNWDDVEGQNFDVAIISNWTNMHLETARQCAQRGMHLFLEKPIDCTLEGLDALIRIAHERALSTYVAYPLRHHRVIRNLKQRLVERSVRHVSMVNASFLPAWRPGRDHLATYSARAQCGGGVFLDMSHELDLAVHLFGPVLDISGRLDRVSEVTIDSDDCADVLLTHMWGTSNIQLNSFSHAPRRVIEIETSDGHLRADLRHQVLTDRRGDLIDEETFTADSDDMYVEQLRYFLGHLGETELDNCLQEASGLYRAMIAFREEQGYGTADHHLRARRVAGGS